MAKSKRIITFALAKYAHTIKLLMKKEHSCIPWPIRLSVRTRDFHSLKSSSTLLWATTVRGFVCNSRETPAFSRIIRCIPQHCHRPRFPALPERRLSALFRDRDFQSTCTVGGIFTIRRCPMQDHSGHNSRHTQRPFALMRNRPGISGSVRLSAGNKAKRRGVLMEYGTIFQAFP